MEYYDLSKIGGDGFDGVIVDIHEVRAVQATEADIFGEGHDSDHESIWLRVTFKSVGTGTLWAPIHYKGLGHPIFMTVEEGGKKLGVAPTASGSGRLSKYYEGSEQPAMLFLESVSNAQFDLGQPSDLSTLDGQRVVLQSVKQKYRDKEGNMKESKTSYSIIASFLEVDDEGPKPAAKAATKKAAPKKAAAKKVVEEEPAADEEAEDEINPALVEAAREAVATALSNAKTKELRPNALAIAAYRHIDQDVRKLAVAKELIAFIQTEEFLLSVELPEPWELDLSGASPVLKKG